MRPFCILFILLPFCKPVHAQKVIDSNTFYFDYPGIGLLRLQPIGDTGISGEFDPTGFAYVYCFISRLGACDITIYKHQKLYLKAHYCAGKVSRKKDTIEVYNPGTNETTLIISRVLKPRRCGTWTYYIKTGAIRKTKKYNCHCKCFRNV